jgi:GH15 family glucan-1,4-alpha-glucosidase
MSASQGRTRWYAPIADYGLIGDCHTAALIAKDGSIDWYCPGRFDAPAVFCRLLDTDRGGFMGLAPAGRFQASRRYHGPTALLETTFTAADGRLRLTDFMPISQRTSHQPGQHTEGSHRLLRLVEALDGEPLIELQLRPTFDYARAKAELSLVDGRGAVARSDDRYLTLTCPGLKLELDGAGGLRGQLRMRAGEQRWVELSYAENVQEARTALGRSDGPTQLAATTDFWTRWAAACTYHGPYRDAVLRSALVLKLLTYEPTGAIVAAPTTSLPEQIGGVRNWDYRFTWLRDSSLMLYALLTIGYHAEAADFFEWLQRTEQAHPAPIPQIMYTIAGGRELPERTLHHLEGYRGSRPVRIGNSAADQQQLDIFGEVLAAAYLYFNRVDPGQRDPDVAERDGRPRPQVWQMLRSLVDAASERWQQPGHGIWEVRGEPREFLYGRLRCWTALDRGIKLAERYRLDAPLDRWGRAAKEIKRAILARGYDTGLGAFTQAFGSPVLDASALAIPRLGLLPATDPRVQSTIARIRSELTHNRLVYRYRAQDGLPGGEATFVLCTYWLVDALALGGKLDDAHQLFESVTGYANDLGLLAEEIDSATGELLGNFPQGFSHMALIGAAVNLAKAGQHGAEDRTENEAERAGRAGPAASAAAQPDEQTGR